MIKVNMLDVERQKVNAAVAAALRTIRNRSFSGRHPELGKMVNCPVCDRRHRGAICGPVYAVGRYATEKVPLIASQDTYKGIYGAHTVAKKRLRPHAYRRGLQLVQRTQQIFSLFEPYISDPQECMREARKAAYRQLTEERKKEAKRKCDQQKLSRRINHSLLKGNALLRTSWGTPPKTETKNKRQDRAAMRTMVNAIVKEAANGGSVQS